MSSAQRSNSHVSKESTLEELDGLVKAALRPLPDQTGDGTYITPPQKAGFLHSLFSLKARDVPTIFDLVRNFLDPEPVDDKTYLMEKVIQLATDLPLNSTPETDITDSLRNLLWNDLAHPPLVSAEEHSKYRSADGSGNSIREPKIGAADTPYARTVSSKILQKRSLPEPEQIFDNLLAREEFKPHPTKISSFLFCLATLITHDIFDSDPDNPAINKNSSYLDLSPLYGRNQDEQSRMRTFRDGQIKADSFADSRVLGQPPGVGVLLILFNRWHNHAVDQLAKINEHGRFTKPSAGNEAGLEKYDEDLFQTGRLITCNLYCNVILRDYVRTILNMNRTDSSWTLDPRPSDGSTHTGQVATGNQVSVEFNFIYRWHATISARDEAGIKAKFQASLQGKDPDTVEWKDLLSAMQDIQKSVPDDPSKRELGTFRRNSNGTFSDQDLAGVLSQSVEEVSGAFGANNVPKSMRAIEILGILRARRLNLATLNEFRAFFKLKTYETFEEINPDPKVSNALKHLYDHPDYVELYPGILAESAKDPMVPGSGLCTSYTISRAILSDAVALVRGDRFYTVDLTPQNLTNWGYKESGYDVNVDQGQVLYKLILRGLPQSFKPNSVYAHFPFVIPAENKAIHTRLGIDDQYDYSEPSLVAPPVQIFSHAAALQILRDPENFKVTWGEKIEYIMSNSGKVYGKAFMLSGDSPPNARSRCIISKALYRSDWRREVADFYTATTKDLLGRHSSVLTNKNTVNLVRDVINPAQAHFAAEVFCIPMKTASSPLGIYTEQETYMIMALIFTYIFLDLDPVNSFPLQTAARKYTQQIGSLVLALLEAEVKSKSWLGAIFGLDFGRWFDRHNATKIRSYGMHILHELLLAGYTPEELVWTHVLPTAGGMVGIQGQLLSEVMDFYLRPENKTHWAAIVELSTKNTPEADDLIQRYILEASRLQTSIGAIRDVSSTATASSNVITITDVNTTHTFVPGSTPASRILLNFSSANLDPSAFPSPQSIDLARPLDSYLTFGHDRHACLGRDMSLTGLAAMIKVFAGLKGLRRSKGAMGDMGRVEIGDGFHAYQAEDGTLWPFPAGMRVEWDL